MRTQYPRPPSPLPPSVRTYFMDGPLQAMPHMNNDNFLKVGSNIYWLKWALQAKGIDNWQGMIDKAMLRWNFNILYHGKINIDA